MGVRSAARGQGKGPGGWGATVVVSVPVLSSPGVTLMPFLKQPEACRTSAPWPHRPSRCQACATQCKCVAEEGGRGGRRGGYRFCMVVIGWPLRNN